VHAILVCTFVGNCNISCSNTIHNIIILYGTTNEELLGALPDTELRLRCTRYSGEYFLSRTVISCVVILRRHQRRDTGAPSHSTTTPLYTLFLCVLVVTNCDLICSILHDITNKKLLALLHTQLRPAVHAILVSAFCHELQYRV